MKDLFPGYRRFRAAGWPEQRRRFAEFAAEGQSPRAMVIACSDSRVDPSQIFDPALGDDGVFRPVST